MDPIRKAKEDLAALENRRSIAAALLEQKNSARTAAALTGSLAAPGSPARERLNRLTDESMRAALELENLDAAVHSARHCVVVAEEDARLDVCREDAAEARKLFDELVTLGAGIDEALATFVGRYERFQSAFDAIHRLGFAPRGEIARVSLRRVVSTRLGGISLAELLPPGQRVSLSDLIAGWRREGEHKIKIAIGEQDEAAD